MTNMILKEQFIQDFGDGGPGSNAGEEVLRWRNQKFSEYSNSKIFKIF